MTLFWPPLLPPCDILFSKISFEVWNLLEKKCLSKLNFALESVFKFQKHYILDSPLECQILFERIWTNRPMYRIHTFSWPSLSVIVLSSNGQSSNSFVCFFPIKYSCFFLFYFRLNTFYFLNRTRRYEIVEKLIDMICLRGNSEKV